MEMRKIVWNKKALRSFHLKAFWYEYNCSHQFVTAFQKNILSSVTSIANMPTIGRNIKEEGGKSWRFFVAHPECKIYYWYNDTELHIIDLIFSAQAK